MLYIKSFEFSPIQENTYLVYNDFNDCLVIDPGCYFDEEKEALSDFVQKQGLRPVRLLNTHCHLDHVFGNKYVAETWGLKPEIHPREKTLLDYAPTSGLMYNLPFDNYQGEVSYINEGDSIRLGDDELTVILNPGHSPGSLSFYCPAQDFVISGDALFYRSIGRTDLPGGDHDTLLNSIREKLFVLPDQTKVYSGHGPVTTIGEERRENPFLRDE